MQSTYSDPAQSAPGYLDMSSAAQQGLEINLYKKKHKEILNMQIKCKGKL